MSFVSLSEFIDGLIIEEISLDRDIFELLLDHVKSVGIGHGFEDEQLNQTLKGILDLNLRPLELRDIFLYMIPKNAVLPETLDFVLAWCFSRTQNSERRKLIKHVFKWLIALIKCEILDAKELKHTFYILLNFLEFKEVHEESCYLLYLILDYEFVTEYTVNRLTSLKSTRSLLAVLSLCKRFKRHLFDDDDIIRDEMQNFPKLSAKLMQNICLWKAPFIEDSATETRFPNYKSQGIAFKNKITGHVSYIGEMSLAESFREAKNSGLYYSGTSFDSLITNKFGFVYIILGGKPLQDITLEYIRRTLFDIEKNLNGSQNESTKCFLSNIFQLQKFWQQAIVPVHHFFLRSFKTWNGDNYTEEILGLLSGIVITPYSQFFTDVVKPIYKLLLQGNDHLSSSVLASLAMLLYNNVKYLSNSPILASSPPPKPYKEDIKRVQKCFKHFCLLHINMNKENCVILHKVVDCHILLSELQSDIEIDFLLPNGVFDQILINADCVLVNKAAKLLMKKYQSSSPEFGYTKALLMQISDLKTVYFKNIFQEHSFSKSILLSSIYDKFSNSHQAKRCFRIRNSLTFHHINHYSDEGKYVKEYTHQEFRKRLKSYCPDLVEVLKLLATMS